jgi:HlyD family secretion protein
LGSKALRHFDRSQRSAGLCYAFAALAKPVATLLWHQGCCRAKPAVAPAETSEAVMTECLRRCCSHCRSDAASPADRPSVSAGFNISARALIPALVAMLTACTPTPPPPFSGYVEVEPTRIAAPIAGRLTQLAVERGAQVLAGAALFTLEQDSEAAALRESQSRADRATAAARDLSTGQRPDEIAATQAAVDAAQAALAKSDDELKRQRELVGQGFVSPAAIAVAQSARDADAARLRAAQAQLRVARLGGRVEARSAATAEAAAASEVVAQSRWRLAQKTVVAPVSARVDDSYFRVGEWVAAGAAVVALIEPGAIRLRFFVPESRLGEVAVGARVKVGCDGCPAGLHALVSFVATEAEFTPPVIYSRGSREKLVFRVEAKPDAADRLRLRPGQPVDVVAERP